MQKVGARLTDQIHVARKRLSVLGGNDSLHHLYFLHGLDTHRIDVIEIRKQRPAAPFGIAVRIGTIYGERGGGPAQAIQPHAAVAIAVSRRRPGIAHRHARAHAQQIRIIASRERNFGHHFAIDALPLFRGDRIHLWRSGVHVHRLRHRSYGERERAPHMLSSGQFQSARGERLESLRFNPDVVSSDA